jgi:hypothetical protein
MLWREIMALFSLIHIKHVTTQCGQNVEFVRVKLVVHIVTTGIIGLNLCYKNQLIFYREIIAVCSQIHTKHISKLCGQNVELLNVKLAVHIVTTGL